MYDLTTLTLPGWNGSGPTHWQTLWERAHPEYRRIEQRDWHDARRDEWVATIAEAVAAAEGRVVLVAHSLACVAVAAWAGSQPDQTGRVAGALLVTPPDLDRLHECPLPLQSFRPVPRQRLPFRSLLVGSKNDLYMTADAARELAKAWGSEFFNAGAVGHINVNSGHGPWPVGERLLAGLIARIPVDRIPVSALTDAGHLQKDPVR